MNGKRLIIFIDSGDTLVNEATEVFDADEVVLHSELIEGAADALKALHDWGHLIALVADGRLQSFDNIYAEQGLRYCFDGWVVSEVLNTRKPDALMFQTAMDQLGLGEADKGRIIMVGNNLSRDVLGANLFGIASVFLDWSPRYPHDPGDDREIPDYVIHTPSELPVLVERLEEAVGRGEQIKHYST
jgi:putative hydrolase of the HAD superfamily